MCRLHRLAVEEKRGEEEGVRAGRRRREEEEGADVEQEKTAWGEVEGHPPLAPGQGWVVACACGLCL